MTPSLALGHFVLAATSKSSSTNPLITLLPLLAIGVLGYFFFIRPQQRKAQAARQTQGSGFEVGDEVQTVGGVIGTVLEVHGDRYTLLTGALGDDGNLDGPQPTRIVFVRQAIAKKIERVEDIGVDDQPDEAIHDIKRGTSSNGSTSASASADDDIDDVGGDGAASSGEHTEEAEEA
ncbi:MAG TPA: preprotein translocase subunit YajC [Acidimicrobiales bacterium]|jgi:preprotein translocase subunit YajC